MKRFLKYVAEGKIVLQIKSGDLECKFLNFSGMFQMSFSQRGNGMLSAFCSHFPLFALTSVLCPVSFTYLNISIILSKCPILSYVLCKC